MRRVFTRPTAPDTTPAEFEQTDAWLRESFRRDSARLHRQAPASLRGRCLVAGRTRVDQPATFWRPAIAWSCAVAVVGAMVWGVLWPTSPIRQIATSRDYTAGHASTGQLSSIKPGAASKVPGPRTARGSPRQSRHEMSGATGIEKPADIIQREPHRVTGPATTNSALPGRSHRIASSHVSPSTETPPASAAEEGLVGGGGARRSATTQSTETLGAGASSTSTGSGTTATINTSFKADTDAGATNTDDSGQTSANNVVAAWTMQPAVEGAREAGTVQFIALPNSTDQVQNIAVTATDLDPGENYEVLVQLRGATTGVPVFAAATDETGIFAVAVALTPEQIALMRASQVPTTDIQSTNYTRGDPRLTNVTVATTSDLTANSNAVGFTVATNNLTIAEIGVVILQREDGTQILIAAPENIAPEFEQVPPLDSFPLADITPKGPSNEPDCHSAPQTCPASYL